MSVKERLILYIKHKKLSQSNFEKSVGLSNGYVNNIRKSILPDTLQKISLNYPDLNTGWLITGEGEMMKNTYSTETVEHALKSPIEHYGVVIDEINRLLKVIESQQETIHKLTDMLFDRNKLGGK